VLASRRLRPTDGAGFVVGVSFLQRGPGDQEIRRAPGAAWLAERAGRKKRICSAFRAAEMGRKAHHRYLEYFTAGQMVDRYADLYCEVITKRQL